MARQSKSTNPAATSSQGYLGLSDLRNRLNFLEKENDKLLKQIESNRTKLNNLNDSIKDVGIQIAQRIAPFRQKILELDHQIHDVFKEIFAGRKLGKKSRKDIESVYYHLQADGLISPQKLPTAADVEVDDSEDESEWRGYERRSHQEVMEDIARPDRDDLKKIRQLFLRLADRFHPDKVTDEVEKAFRTEVMKEINLAYQNGDLARLLEIEKQQELEALIDRDSSDDLTRHCAKVESENSFLKEQLATLKQQLKLTKKTQQGEMTAVFKKITKYGGDPIGEALFEVEAHVEVVEQLHKFVLDFRDRRITIQEFLRVPTDLMQQQMTEEELMLEFLSQFQR
ncbi:J domain-containing protein [Pseudanabaena sp. BC1403]|uniref:J domain-containing protein n=1 Tax=Pseudanabaena sp. BC1403 TaxID=2043171 RepID=UPI000CD7EA60|nr:J domain-containing protein [Pseudanabaena sp. BC1403]